MRRLLSVSFLLWLLAPATAQRSLAKLQQEFAAAVQQLGAETTHEQQLALLKKQIPELERFLASEAKDADRWNGRLMLADLQLAVGEQKAASKTLEGIDQNEAPALLLVSSAAMAQHLGLRPLRDAMITAALGKSAPVEDQLAMARLLMTVLHEVKKGEALFDKALAEAKDDEQRAAVRWHRADGLRDREDLSEDAMFEELEKLTNELPNTYWGGIAKDVLRATKLQRGDDAIDFKAKTRTGEDLTLASLRGKAVALVFFEASDRDLPRLLDLLKASKTQLGDKLAIVGICLNRDPGEIDKAIRALGITFPVIGEGKGFQTDAALRWFVASPVVHVIDENGKVVALGQHAGTADARAELSEALSGSAK